MKKIVEIIKKHDNICVFIYMIMALSVYVYTVPLSSYDELWNFSFVYKITNGYEIYKDLNVIITPLFHYIGKLIFLLFGNNFISFRMYNIFIYSTLFTTIYSLFKKLKIEKLNAFVYILIIFLIIKDIIAAGANYNLLVIIFVLLGIMLELKNNKQNNKINNILKGLNLFCIFMTKQNVFVFYCIAIFILYLMQLKQIKTKSIIKDKIISVCIICASFIVPLIIFITYLAINNILYDFISYCFLGMFEFGINNIVSNIYVIIYFSIAIIGIVLSILLLKIKEISKDIKSINFIFMPFQIIMLCCVYPIINMYHLKVSMLILIILMIYNLHNIFVKTLIDKKILNRIIYTYITIMTLYFLLFNSYMFIKYRNFDNVNYDINPYYNIIISSELKNNIITICSYINENEKNNIDTKIISYKADLYMNILNKNNKNLDLPFLGNLGKDGEDGLISEVRNLNSGTKILISKEKFWQESEKLRNIIINNYKKIGEIEDYYIYEK